MECLQGCSKQKKQVSIIKLGIKMCILTWVSWVTSWGLPAACNVCVLIPSLLEHGVPFSHFRHSNLSEVTRFYRNHAAVDRQNIGVNSSSCALLKVEWKTYAFCTLVSRPWDHHQIAHSIGTKTAKPTRANKNKSNTWMRLLCDGARYKLQVLRVVG